MSEILRKLRSHSRLRRDGSPSKQSTESLSSVSSINTEMNTVSVESQTNDVNVDKEFVSMECQTDDIDVHETFENELEQLRHIKIGYVLSELANEKLGERMSKLNKEQLTLLQLQRELLVTRQNTQLIDKQLHVLRLERRAALKDLQEVFEETVGYADSVEKSLPKLHQQYLDIKTDKDCRQTLNALQKVSLATRQLEVLLHKKHLDLKLQQQLGRKGRRWKPTEEKPRSEQLEETWETSQGFTVTEKTDFKTPSAPVLKRKVYKRSNNQGGSQTRNHDHDSLFEEAINLFLSQETTL